MNKFVIGHRIPEKKNMEQNNQDKCAQGWNMRELAGWIQTLPGSDWHQAQCGVLPRTIHQWDKCFQLAQVIAAPPGPPNYEDLQCEYWGRIVQDRIEHNVLHCGCTSNERDTFWDIVTNVWCGVIATGKCTLHHTGHFMTGNYMLIGWKLQSII